MTVNSVEIGERLSLEAVCHVARGTLPVMLNESVRQRVLTARGHIEAILATPGRQVYGVNTGFGALAEVAIDTDQVRTLQRNLILSHSCGIGRPFDRRTTRTIMLLRAQVLALGHSGVRVELLELLLAMLNRGVHPQIPERGSVGASGDLAPLAHLALVMIGEGSAELEGAVIPGREALRRVGLEPIELEAKEGLSLINGTQVMTAMGALLCDDAADLLKAADIAGAMSLDALMGTPKAFDEEIQLLRGHPGQLQSAENLRALLDGSAIVSSHTDCRKVQDPYSLRCMPQVHGATRDVVTFARQLVEVELNAATDNPLVLANGDLASGGNFHGQPVAFALDFLAIALAEIANIAERRIEQLVNPHLNCGLPAFLTPHVGLNSGFMIAQVAAASLVSENKVLAHPASVDSIPSSANREDHVSMGVAAGLKARVVLNHTRCVLAIELMCAAQAIDLRLPVETSPALRAVHQLIRQQVDPLSGDRQLSPDIAAVDLLLTQRRVSGAAETRLGHCLR